MSETINHRSMMLHTLRNPHGHSDDEVRKARLWAGDEIERLERWLRAYGVPFTVGSEPPSPELRAYQFDPTPCPDEWCDLCGRKLPEHGKGCSRAATPPAPQPSDAKEEEE